MKDQINRYARGVFEYEPEIISVKDSSINVIVDRNREHTGTIEFGSVSGRDIKGIIYTDNDKVKLKENTFYGNHISVQYMVNCDDAVNGDSIEGVFNIVSNGGECSIPYTFMVEAGSHDSSVGVVRNLSQFADLAESNPLEALKLFENADFEDVYIGNDLALRCIYESLIKSADTSVALEEFLISIHKKSSINITLSGNSAEFKDLTANYKDVITVERDTWGHMDVSVYTSSPFIRLDRTVIESELFAGGKYELAYIIDTDRLHAGINYGEIVFETINRRVVFNVKVIRNTSGQAKETGRSIGRLDIELMTLYIRFRTHKINISDWMRESQIILETIREKDDSDPFYRLALAQIYISGHRDDAAKELIENVKDEIDTRTEAGYPLYCYFMYINTLYNRDRAYSRKAAAIVRECYKANEDWRILWVLLFMDEELEQNKSLKLLRIKEQFNKGCTSPAMYIEACNILNEHPELLRVLNSFETNVLLFGAKNGIISDRLKDVISEMLLDVKSTSSGNIALLETLYKDNEDDEVVLEALCKILVRMAAVGEKYLHYYRKAIDNELKITQLFEYYIMSRRQDDMSVMPKLLLMYFGYNNNLDYRYKAYLFANIIHNKSDNIQVYRSYLPQMQLFARKQIAMGHVNTHLAYIYRNIFTPDMVNEENAQAVSEVYYTYRVKCMNPKMRGVIVRHKESNSEKEYPLIQGEAYVRMYTEQASLLFAAADYNRYGSEISHTVTRLFDDDVIIRKCLEMDPGLVHIRLSSCEKYLRREKKNLAEVESLIELSKLPEVNRLFRAGIISSVIEYFYDGYDEDGFNKFIADVDMDGLSEDDIVKVAEIYIVQGHDKDAFELVRKHSAMHIAPKRLMRMCSRLIEEANYVYEDDLAYISSLCYAAGSYDEVLTAYLVRYYNGTSDKMVALWKSAIEMGVDAYELEERIIAQIMFTHSNNELIHDIFEDYYAKGPDRRIVEAYLSYFSYMYFVKQEDVSEKVFDTVETAMENGQVLATVCSLALLKHYSEIQNLNEFQKELTEELLTELVRRSYVFPFYKQLSTIVKLPCDIIDKTMVEYRTDPSHKVVIHYVYEDDKKHKSYVSEEMNNVYEGIFVKSFVLFNGESINYYISEEKEDGESNTETARIVNNGINPYSSKGRYEAINDIIASRKEHDNETLKKLIHTYAVNECIIPQLFKPL